MTPEVRAAKLAEETAMSVSSDTAGPAAAGNGGNGAAAVTNGGSVAPVSALTDSPPVVPARLAGLDLGPACNQCGGIMQRTGSCYTCPSCGNNTGCG